jgi:hypothetical protein
VSFLLPKGGKNYHFGKKIKSIGNVQGQLTLLDESPDEHVLRRRLEGHEVHAVLAADVAALQPVHLVVLESLDPAGVEVAVAVVGEVDGTLG